MDSKRAVHIYHRNLAIAVGLILLVFALIPMAVKSPYLSNIFVLVFYMSPLSLARNLLKLSGVLKGGLVLPLSKKKLSHGVDFLRPEKDCLCNMQSKSEDRALWNVSN